MAAFLFLAQLLLLLGTLVVSELAGTERCHELWNATEGNFSVQVTPQGYQENTTYQVSIKEDNSTANESIYLLQALSPQNETLGQWLGVNTTNCSSVDTAVLNTTQNTAQWTSPGRNVSAVHIRAFMILPGKPIEFKITTLSREDKPTTTPRTTTPNSVPTVQSSSLFIAVLQLPLLLATGTLLS